MLQGENGMSSILFATSPLQVKIAQRVLKEYPNHDFKTIFFTPNLNPKHKRYAAEFDLVFELQTVQQTTDFIEQFSGDYQTILFASFDNPVIATIVKQSTYQELASYDDGYASISPHGMYAALPLGSDLHEDAREFLLNSTQRHYTIYKSDFYVVAKEKVVYLPKAFDFTDVPKASNQKNVRILLGQEISRNPGETIHFISQYAKALEIDFYLPHPKEHMFIPGLPVLDTDLVLEDILPLLWQDYEHITVYHFYSSAALHLLNQDGVEAIGIPIRPVKVFQERLQSLGCRYQEVELDW